MSVRDRDSEIANIISDVYTLLQSYATVAKNTEQMNQQLDILLVKIDNIKPLRADISTCIGKLIKRRQSVPVSSLQDYLNFLAGIYTCFNRYVNPPEHARQSVSVPWEAAGDPPFEALLRRNIPPGLQSPPGIVSVGVYHGNRFLPESPVRLPGDKADTPDNSQTLGNHQTPSPASRELDLQEMYTQLEYYITQFEGVEANMLSEIRQSGKEPSEEELLKFLSTDDVAKENIFKQINKIDDLARRRALGYSYEVYSFAAAHCGILHDKLSTRLATILTGSIFGRYKSFVKTLKTIPHTSGGIQCKDVDSERLITELTTAFSGQFTDCTGNTVGQPRCHAAVEAITEKYCEWLKRYGITLAPSVPVFMTDRQKAKFLLNEIQRNRRAGTKIVVANKSDGERQFVEAVDGATSLADATVSFCDERFGWMGGIPKMDGAPTFSVGAKYLGSESMKTQVQEATVQLKKKQKGDNGLYSFVSEPSSPPAQLDVEFTVWDRDASTLRATANTVRPLSHGILYTYCIEYFDIKRIDSGFVNFFDSNHNNDCFKPLTLMYMPTLMLDEMLKEKSKRYKDLHKSELDKFIQTRCQVAQAAMKRAGKDSLYVPPTVHYEGTVNGMPATLVWVSCGSISNNDSLTIVERVVAGIYNLSVRGGMSMKCSKAHLNEVCCYLGQTVPDTELKDITGKPTGIGEVVVVLGDEVKEYGDWSKADAVDKSQCVLRDNRIQCKSLITTVDKIAAKNVASFAYDIPACLFGQSCTLYIPSCFQNISPEARRDIARLQVKIEQLESLYREQHKEGVHAVFEKKLGLKAKEYAKAIHETSARLESTLSENPQNGHKLLPSILTALEIADIFDRPGGWLVPVKKFEDLVNKPLSSEVHFGARNPESFVSLFMEPERKSELVEALGGLDLVINQDNWVTPKRDCNVKPHTDSSLRDMLIHKLENLPECDIEYTPDFAYKKCEEIFKGVKHVFILLDHYHEFASDSSFFRTRFGVLGRGHERDTISVDYKVLRSRALDPTIISLLKAHIESTTTPRSIYRTRCEAAVTRLFPSYDTVQEAEDYDTASMLEATAREEASVSQEGLPSSTLECPNEASVDPPPDRYSDVAMEVVDKRRERSRSKNHVTPVLEVVGKGYVRTGSKNAPPLDDQTAWPPLSDAARPDSRRERRERREQNQKEEKDRRRGGSRKKNKHNITKKYKTMSRKSRQTRRNKYKHIRTIKRRKSRRNNRN